MLPKWDQIDLRRMYMGFSYWEWLLPVNPRKTHNYLERTYSRAQNLAHEDMLEADEIFFDPVYQDYFYLK